MRRRLEARHDAAHARTVTAAPLPVFEAPNISADIALRRRRAKLEVSMAALAGLNGGRRRTDRGRRAARAVRGLDRGRVAEGSRRGWSRPTAEPLPGCSRAPPRRMRAGARADARRAHGISTATTARRRRSSLPTDAVLPPAAAHAAITAPAVVRQGYPRQLVFDEPLAPARPAEAARRTEACGARSKSPSSSGCAAVGRGVRRLPTEMTSS